MNIVITVDDNYIRPALIMLESLFEQNRTSMHIYLLHSNVCAENLSKLTRHVAALGGDFTDIRVDGALFENTGKGLETPVVMGEALGAQASFF